MQKQDNVKIIVIIQLLGTTELIMYVLELVVEYSVNVKKYLIQ